MADGHCKYNRNLPHGFQLGRFLEEVGNALAHGPLIRDTLAQMKQTGGDPDQAATYSALTSALGTENDTDSMNLFKELDSMVGKLTTDASQANVNAALKQGLAKLNN